MVPLGSRVGRPRCSRRPREPALLVRVGMGPAFWVLRVVGRRKRKPKVVDIEPKPPRIIEIRKMKKPRVIEIRDG